MLNMFCRAGDKDGMCFHEGPHFFFHVVRQENRYRTMCGQRGDKQPILDSLAMKDDPEWFDTGASVCLDCVKMMKPGRTLWGVAAERLVIDNNDSRKRRRWIPDGITYVHGNDQEQAKAHYVATAERNTRIVAIGRVIGYHIEDKDGLKLSVD